MPRPDCQFYVHHHSIRGSVEALAGEFQGQHLPEPYSHWGSCGGTQLGQALSTRPDILPQAYCKELSRLQDRMPPFPNKAALAAIQAQLGRPASQVFAEISSEPVAAASLGQVYKGAWVRPVGGHTRCCDSGLRDVSLCLVSNP